MKSGKFLAALLVCIAIFVCAFSVSAAPTGDFEGFDGWWYESTDEEYYYYENGVLVTNEWITDTQGTYYVGADGYRYRDGIHTVGDKQYAFLEGGELCKDAVIFYSTWDEETGDYSNTFYGVDENGVIIKNRWAKPAYTYYYASNNTDWYYFGADGVAYKGVQKVGDKYYFFDTYVGSLLYEGPAYLWDEENQEGCYYYALGAAYGDGALAQNKWLKDEEGDWTYYDSSCKRVNSRSAWINGKLYAFDENGKMYADGLYNLYDYQEETWSYYYASADGSLAVNRWIEYAKPEEEEKSWYYFGTDGKAYRDGAYKVGNAYYYFYSDARMAANTEIYTDEWSDELETWLYVGTYRARANGTLYINTWFQENGNTYYYGADGKGAVGITTISGKKYAFNEYGRMLKDEVCSIYLNGTYTHLIVTADGVPYEALNNKWTKVSGKWYYVQDNQFCVGELFEIGGKRYAFSHAGQMYENELFDMSLYDQDGNYIGWFTFFAKADGVLAQNEVITTTRYGDTVTYLFGEDSRIPDVYGIYDFNGTYYYLQGSSEPVLCRELMQLEDGVYAFAADGKGVKLGNGWYHNTLSEYEDEGQWMFVWNDVLFTDGIHTVGDKKYAFDYEGALITDEIYYNEESGSFLLLTAMNDKGQGGFVCEETNVWKTVDGYHVYLNENAVLHQGWLFDKYFMTPYMTYCGYTADENGYVYVFNTAGQSQKVTTTGFLSVCGDTGYVENGKLVMNAWRKLQNSWYYFGEGGEMYANMSATIGDVLYAFDHNGKMCNSGWFRGLNGEWYWAAKSGALYTGKDSAGYVFAQDGALVVDNVYEIDGVWYITNKDGKAVGSFNKAGWNKVNNNWYYVQTYPGETETLYEVMKGGYRTADGRFYAFENNGKMLTNCFYEEGRYYLGGDGAVQRWFKVGGYWYYGDPEDYGYLYNDGIYTINEKEYLFDNTGKLLQSVTVYSWERNAIVTTDSEGIIVKENPVNGWVYHVDTRWGNGIAYYYVNGFAYNGWLGNYYIQYGTMLIDDFVYDEEANVYYYVNKKGVKQGTGWYERWDNYWMYIRSDGTVVYNDWLKIGTKWYYFDDYQMASGDSYKIDGVWHSFDDNGVWLGETKDTTPDCTGKADGWFKYNGEWYFAMAGKVATDKDLYSNGKWYHLDYQGCMIANTFWYNPYAKDESFRYFTADGSMATYKGWQRIKGYWVYFDNANSVKLGWLNVGGKTYYQSIFADENGSYTTFNIGILTGYQVIDDVLYQFNSDGALVKTITTKGWYKGGSDWYYIEADGFVARNESAYKIGNAYYAFDGDGKMVANDVYDGHYYNASGVMVTKAGWYQVGKKWIYVMDGGIVAQNGVLRIGNKDYYFSDSYWLG